jgi:hypothetical protein
MGGSRGIGPAAVGVLTAAVLATAGCDTQVVGRPTFAEPPRPATTPAAQPTGTPSTTGPATTGPAPTTQPSSTPAAGTVPTEFGGTWTGNMSQPNSVLPHWLATLVLTAGRSGGTFTVGTICHGPVVVLSASPTRLTLREVIGSDPTNRCAASGTITMQRTSPIRATMRWVDSDHADNIATGTLGRH